MSVKSTVARAGRQPHSLVAGEEQAISQTTGATVRRSGTGSARNLDVFCARYVVGHVLAHCGGDEWVVGVLITGARGLSEGSAHVHVTSGNICATVRGLAASRSCRRKF
jgi:hypothetical protein